MILKKQEYEKIGKYALMHNFTGLQKDVMKYIKSQKDWQSTSQISEYLNLLGVSFSRPSLLDVFVKLALIDLIDMEKRTTSKTREVFVKWKEERANK